MQPDTVTMTNGTVVKVEQGEINWYVSFQRRFQDFPVVTGHFKTYAAAKREQQYIIELEGKGQLA